MRLLLLLSFLALTCAAQRQQTANTIRLDEGASPGKATIQHISWLAGQWHGEGLSGGRAEEIWTPPHAGVMFGTFRQLKGQEVWFYEILNIAEKDGSLVLRLKHFHSDLKGWEEKDVVREFRLVKIDDRGAWFDGISMLREGGGGMDIYVALKGKDGALTEGKFTYRRVSAMQPLTR